MDDNLRKVYGKNVRVRVMGLLFEDDRLLLVNHQGLNKQNELWLPPGGGVEFGLSLEECLVKEFKEETNLDVEVGEVLFTHEYISDDLHAIEFFYGIKSWSGEVHKGFDPELGENQIITDVRFMTFSELASKGSELGHQVFSKVQSYEDLARKSDKIHFKSII